MTYITSIEQIGYKRGKQEGEQRGEQKGEQKGLLIAIKLALDLKFGTEGLQFYPTVAQITDMDRLQDIYIHLIAGASLDELRYLSTDV